MELDFNRMTDSEQLWLYVDHMHPMINRDALYADGTEYYRSFIKDADGYRAVLRFRTERDNVQRVQVVVDGVATEMEKCAQDRLFDYYESIVPCQKEGQAYYFRVSSGNMVVYYHKRGPTNDIQTYYSFQLVPEFHTPQWAKGAVFYQIFVDRFFNGDPSNDVLNDEYSYVKKHVQKVEDWNSFPQNMDVHRFYGGDLAGVMQKLDYLQDLGVEVIYLNPIFVSPSNHKYDIQDYDYVDPHFGKIVRDEGRVLKAQESSNQGASRYICRVTNQENLEAGNALFIELVEEIHRRGMRIILDGVFNHCGSFNKWMDRERIYENQNGYEKGAYVAQESPYHSFFKFDAGSKWPYNGKYEGWWGHDTLPKLNYEESSILEEYILRIAAKWVSPPYNVDGWRLDVAADLGHSSQYNHKFWKKFRETVKKANPDAIILAEHYGDPEPWLKGDQWDTVMNYDAFMEPVTWFLTGMEKHSDEYSEKMLGNNENFWGAMTHHMSRFHQESLYVSMNELSNHDHSRFLTRTNHTVGRIATKGAEAASKDVDPSIMRIAVVIQMTWLGAPTIYYGDEAGVCGWTDPDSRRTYPWGHENQEMLAFHKDMIRIHKSYEVLKYGSIKLWKGKRNVLYYGRFDLSSQAVVALNRHPSETVGVDIPVWQMGVLDGETMRCLIRTDQNGYQLDAGTFQVGRGVLHMELPPKSAFVLYHRRGVEEEQSSQE